MEEDAQYSYSSDDRPLSPEQECESSDREHDAVEGHEWMGDGLSRGRPGHRDAGCATPATVALVRERDAAATLHQLSQPLFAVPLSHACGGSSDWKGKGRLRTTAPPITLIDVDTEAKEDAQPFWRCANCTYACNKYLYRRCEMCGAEPEAGPSRWGPNLATDEEPSAPDGATQVESKVEAAADGSWSCAACTYVNSTERTNCEICDTEKAANEVASSIRSSEASPASGAAHTIQPKVEERADGSWSCHACTFMNSAEQSECEVCETNRSGYEQEPPGHETSCTEKPVSDSATSGPEGVRAVVQKETENGDGDEVRYRLAAELAQAFSGRRKDGKHVCKVCGKTHSTANLMNTHFLKGHLDVFADDLSMRNVTAMRVLTEHADRRMAEALERGEAVDVEDDDEGDVQHGGGGEGALRAAPIVARRKRSSSGAVKRDVGRTNSGGLWPAAHRPRTVKQRAVSYRDVEEEEDEDEEEVEVYGGHEEEREDGEEVDRAGSEDSEEEEEYEGDDGTDDETGSSSSRRKKCAHATLGDRKSSGYFAREETPEEAEVRKQKRLALLVEKTSSILKQLEQELASLITPQAAPASGSRDQAASADAVMEQPRMLENVVLRDYQLVGLSWLFSLFKQNLNGILADEMGLGKTIQVISLLCQLHETRSCPGLHLVVVPLSVITNWEGDLRRCAPGLNVHVYRGSKGDRTNAFAAVLRRWLRLQAGAEAMQAPPPAPLVVLTTYDMLLRDYKALRGAKHPWSYVVVDEAHRLKNQQGKLNAVTRKVRSRRRLLLTGTPLQNAIRELFSLLTLTVPKLFSSVSTMSEWFNAPFEDESSVAKDLRVVELTEEEKGMVIRQLHSVLRPFLLRRTKEMVLASLPKKHERMVWCPLSSLQIRLYRLLRRQLCDKSKSSSTGTRRLPFSLNNMLMQYRKLCNHPYLLLADAVSDVEWVELAENLVSAAGKLVILHQVLLRLKALGRRTLIFSQFTSSLDILEDYLEREQCLYLRLDGNTPAADRGQLIQDWNASESPCGVFLISTKAGGQGINLQSADTVILHDSSFNPADDNQAQARVHRLGQTTDVLVLRLVCVGPEAGVPSVEERICAVAARKLRHEALVIGKGDFTLTRKQSGEDRDNTQSTLHELLMGEMEGGSAPITDGGGGDGDAGRMGGSAAENLRWDLLDGELLDNVCARNDDELTRLQAQRLSDGEEPGPLLMTEHDLPACVRELERRFNGPAEGHDDGLLVSGKRLRKSRFDSLSESHIQATEEAPELKASSSDRKRRSPTSGMEDDQIKRPKATRRERDKEQPCVACAMNGAATAEAGELVTCQKCTGAWHVSCADVQGEMGVWVCAWCMEEGG